MASSDPQNITSATGTNLSTQWRSLTGQSASGTWQFATDMAIDADGNFYLFVHRSATAHALVRLNVPKDASGNPRSTGWTYEMVRAFTTSTSSAEVYVM